MSEAWTTARSLLQHALALVALWAIGGLLLQLLRVPLADGLLLLTTGYMVRTIPLVVRSLTGAVALAAGAWWVGAQPAERAAVVEALTLWPAAGNQPEAHEALPDLELDTEAMAARGRR